MKTPSRVLVSRLIIVSLGLAAYVAFLPEMVVDDLPYVLFFATCLFLALILDVQLPQGGTASTGGAVLLACVLILPLPEILAVVALGTVPAMFVENARVERGLFSIAQKAILVTAASLVFGWLGGTPEQVAEPLRYLPVLILTAITLFGLAIGLDQWMVGARKAIRFAPAFIAAVSFLLPIQSAFAFLGLLLAVIFKGMGYWSALFFFPPLLVTRHSFKLYLDIRKIYRNTIRALALAIDAQDPVRRGHADRVADYAVDIAKELGIYGRQLELLSYAALLHDVGMLGVDDESLDSLLEQVNALGGEAPHAVMGAEILDQVAFLREASHIVRMHHAPFDASKGEVQHPMGARIIAVASRFDELTKSAERDDRLTPREALARLKKEQGIAFDPRVVRALVNVLQKQGRLVESFRGVRRALVGDAL